MPETAPLPRRIGILDGAAPTAHAGVIVVRCLPPASRFVLRIATGEAARIGTVAGVDLTAPINRWSGSEHRMAAHLGPDEWLLIGPEGDGGAMQSVLAAAFGGVHHALVDIGHRNIAIEIGGEAAAAVLNAGCPLDLADRHFPLGSATRTLLGKAEIVLFRLADHDGAACYRVECWRSFGRYVQAFLAEAAKEFSGRQRSEVIG